LGAAAASTISAAEKRYKDRQAHITGSKNANLSTLLFLFAIILDYKNLCVLGHNPCDFVRP
jgi:hypothetical protein